MTFTVVIPTLNRARMAFELIDDIRAGLAWPCPIVVVDQSDDGGAELAGLLRSRGFQGVLHCPQNKRGTSVSRNEGARHVRTSWIIFLDDDVRPASNYLANLRAFIEENPWVDAVQGAVEYDWDDYKQDRLQWHNHRRKLGATRLPRQEHWGGIESLLRTPKAKFPCMVLGLGSGNLAVNYEAFVSVGGFDEQCDGLGEDIELGVRLWWYGYRVCLCPDAVAFHLRATEGGSRLNKQSRWKTLFIPEPAPSLLYFLQKWFAGRAFWEDVIKQNGKWLRRPWTIPIKLIRFCRAMSIAKARLQEGPKYLSHPPLCRAEAMEAERTARSAQRSL